MKNESEAASKEIRILIAEDFLDWRIRIRSILQAVPEWKIVFEASDGTEAVEKARELKPDLILLDIGLPKLNGIEAENRILRLVPSAKVLFLSMNNDPEIIHAALSDGAHGYVLKADVGSELLPAIKTILCGDMFVSSGIKARLRRPTERT